MTIHKKLKLVHTQDKREGVRVETDNFFYLFISLLYNYNTNLMWQKRNNIIKIVSKVIFK